MTYFWLISGVLLALVWLDRLRDAIRGGRAMPDLSLPTWDRPAAGLPRLTIVVPARNEGEHVERALRSMLALDYNALEVIAVDDRSSDDTGAVLDRMAGEYKRGPALRVLHIAELPAGWLGKPHAMWKAGQQATGDWILFTDADVCFRADALRRAVAYAEATGADHLVVFPSHILRTPGERMMMAVFALLFVFGHRPWKIDDPDAKDYLGFGPFNLIRRNVYEQIGTARALRLEVIEDMKLGKLVKEHGFIQRAAYGTGLIPWRWFNGTFGMVRVLKKNIFASMNYRWSKAIGASALLGFLTLVPFLAIFLAPGWTKLGHLLALAAIFGLYVGLSRRSAISPLYFFLHPLSTCLIIYAMTVSMAHTIRHGGVVWRGTLYSLNELRKGLV